MALSVCSIESFSFSFFIIFLICFFVFMILSFCCYLLLFYIFSILLWYLFTIRQVRFKRLVTCWRRLEPEVCRLSFSIYYPLFNLLHHSNSPINFFSDLLFILCKRGGERRRRSRHRATGRVRSSHSWPLDWYDKVLLVSPHKRMLYSCSLLFSYPYFSFLSSLLPHDSRSR